VEEHDPRVPIVKKLADGAPWLLLGLVCALTLTSVLTQRPGINSDPGWGIVAAEQFLAARSPSPLSMVVADNKDLSRDHAGRIAWWAPSYQLFPLAFRAIALDWGNALRCTFVACWILGAIGWASLFATAIGRNRGLAFFVSLFLLLRFCHVDAYIYSGGEFLLWACAPHIVLVNLAALRRARQSMWWVVGAGVATPLLFLVKYNAAFLIVGLGVTWTLFVVRRWISWRNWSLYAACGLASLAAIFALGFPGGTTSFDPSVHLRVSWMTLWPFGSSIFAATDWDSLLRWLLEHPSRSILTDRHFETMYAATAPLVIVGLFLMLRTSIASPPGSRKEVARVLSVVCLTTSGALLAFVSAESRSYLGYARYLRVESLLMLPFVVVLLADTMRSAVGLRRVAAGAALFALLVVPSMYGAATLVDKGLLRARSSASLVGPQGIRYVFFEAGEDVPSIVAEIRDRAADDSVLYLPSPELGLAFTDRRFIIAHADFVPVDELARSEYAGSAKGGVVLFLPRRFEHNGKLTAIEDSFRSVGRWREEPLKSTSSWMLVFGSPLAESTDRSARGG
jgi:hypothetical protein